MINYEYRVILTNGKMESEYKIWASSKRSATILAQAEAIKEGCGYEFVSIEVL